MNEAEKSCERGQPFQRGVDGRYGWPMWRQWLGPWRLYAGQWYRMALDAHGYKPDQNSWKRAVYGPRVALSGSREPQP